MGAFKSWQILGKMCDELERKRGRTERGEGKGEEQSELGWTKGLCRTTFSTGSWHEPVLKVDVHKPLVHPSHSVLPLSPHFSSVLPLSPRAPHKFCPKFVKIWRPPSIQMITKVSNFVLSSLIARLALAMLCIVINLGGIIIFASIWFICNLRSKITLSLHM